MIDRIYRLALWFAYRALLLSRRLRTPLIFGSYVAVWSRGRLLLIRNSYKPGDTLPAGGLKRGESHRDAARRELCEEVGLDVPAERLGFVFEVELKSVYGRDRCQFFELLLDRDPQIVIDRREVVSWDFCPAGELADRPLIRSVRAYLKQRGVPPAPARSPE